MSFYTNRLHCRLPRQKAPQTVQIETFIRAGAYRLEAPVERSGTLKLVYSVSVMHEDSSYHT